MTGSIMFCTALSRFQLSIRVISRGEKDVYTKTFAKVIVYVVRYVLHWIFIVTMDEHSGHKSQCCAAIACLRWGVNC